MEKMIFISLFSIVLIILYFTDKENFTSSLPLKPPLSKSELNKKTSQKYKTNCTRPQFNILLEIGQKYCFMSPGMGRVQVIPLHGGGNNCRKKEQQQTAAAELIFLLVSEL